MGGYIHESAPLLFGAGKAVFSADRAYRYQLSRIWGSGGAHAVWIMLNPSKAGACEGDPTVSKCTSFTRAWGLDGLTIVNAFALIATDPRELRRHPDPVGPVNDQFIAGALVGAAVVVTAWGAHPLAARRAGAVMAMAEEAGRDVRCLGVTRDGHPRHPLYVRGDTRLTGFRLHQEAA